MSWFRQWLRPSPHPAPAPASAPRVPADTAPTTDLSRLQRLGDDDAASPDEAVAAFRALRSTPDEGEALQALLRRARRGPLPEELAVLAASALMDRGEPLLAQRMLSEVNSPAARLLLADIHAYRGDLPAALALIERVLLVDYSFPGAADRYRRWRATLGLDVSPQKQDTAGATLAKGTPEAPFRLLREVARGGSGAVYEAQDIDLSRRVALKVYHRPDRDRAQLLHEAKVAVRLAGPGIVRVFDIDLEQAWVALEWAGQGALRELVRARAPELVPLSRWAIPLAEALSRVHAAGWVHHDIKPANVLMRGIDAPVLGDFGTARRAGEPSPPGSIGYVSPERMAGRASHPKDDVYGFGRILEDALNALGEGQLWSRFRPLVTACIGPDDDRPADARAVLTRLRVEPGHT